MSYDAVRSPMDEFDSELRRAFAAIPDPVDAGFTASATKRVARLEQRRSARDWLSVVALGVAGVAVGLAIFSALRGVAPTFASDLGLSVAQLHGALTSGRYLAGLGAALLPLLLAAGAAAGGLAIARAATEE